MRLIGVEIQVEAIIEPGDDAALVGFNQHGRRARDRRVDCPDYVQLAPLDAAEPRLSRFVDGRSRRTFEIAMASIGAAHAELPAGVA
jgi:hypothetical protein